jgi:plastocyanin
VPTTTTKSLFSLAAALLLAAVAPAQAARADEEGSPGADEAPRGALRGSVPAAKSGEPVLVFLKDVPGDYSPRVKTVDIKSGQLQPRVVGVALGDTVKFVNLDGQAHTISSPESGTELGLLERGDARGQLFLRAGAYPVRCAIHRELLGWIFVGPNPYSALADKGGNYEIRDVPGGKFAVGTWSPGTGKGSDAGVAGDAGPVEVAGAPASAPASGTTPAAKPAAPKPAPKPAAPKAETGTIRGVVAAEPAKFLDETVVYLKKVPGNFPIRKQIMDQRKMKFIPHVVPVIVGETVHFLNNDGIVHNVYTNDGEGYNLGMFKDGEERPYTFKREGAYTQLCNIHPDMVAYVFVSQNPYYSVVDGKGNYEIRNVPPGTYTLSIWNSHLNGAEKQVTVERGGAAEVGFTLRR